MAKKEILVDDLDGTQGEVVRPVTFAWDGVAYEIDLSKKNLTAFEKTLKPYLEAARRVKGTPTRRAAAARGGKRDLSAIRSWAEQNGWDVSSRGRIASAVIDAYDAAN